jgi:hypothetical protein
MESTTQSDFVRIFWPLNPTKITRKTWTSDTTSFLFSLYDGRPFVDVTSCLDPTRDVHHSKSHSGP